MKKRIISISVIMILSLYCFLLLSSKSANEEVTKNYFIAEYKIGKSWDNKLSFQEQKYSSHHSKFLSSLRENGVIIFGARYSDKGIIIFHSSDLNTATNLIVSDSAIINNLFNVEVNELSIFYEGCIETEDQ